MAMLCRSALYSIHLIVKKKKSSRRLDMPFISRKKPRKEKQKKKGPEKERE
jgi:hypothetical protein